MVKPGGTVLVMDERVPETFTGPVIGHDILQQQADARVQAHGFFDHGVEVGEVGARFLVADRVGGLAGSVGGVDLAD